MSYTQADVERAQMETYAELLDVYSKYNRLVNQISDHLVYLTFESEQAVKAVYDELKTAADSMEHIAAAFKSYSRSHGINVEEC